MKPGPHPEHHDQRTKEALIGRIAVLSELADRHAADRKRRGLPPIDEPKLAEVRPAILAEGAIAELKRLQAELRIADEDLREREIRIEQLEAELARVRVSGAGVGETGGSAARRREAQPMPDHDEGPEFMPADEDPAIRHQQDLFAAETAAAPAVEQARCETCDAPLTLADPDDVLCADCATSTPTGAAVAERLGQPAKSGQAPRGGEPTAPKRRARKAKALVEPKSAEPEALDATVLRVLKARGDSASAGYVVGLVKGAGGKATPDEVEAALERLADAELVARIKPMGGISMWRAR